MPQQSVAANPREELCELTHLKRWIGEEIHLQVH
jgi:hypothetical protein